MSRVTAADLRLEPLSLDHLDGIMTWVNDPEVTFYFATLHRIITRQDEARIVSKIIASDTDRVFSIFEGDTYLGQIGISQIYWPARNGRLGIMLARNAWGRGVAQAAGRLIIDRAFQELSLHKLWLILRSDNAKGLHIWSKLGFQREGLLRDEYFSADSFHTMVRMGMLETDPAATAL